MNGVETGLIIYAAATLYYSFLATYILVKTNVLSRKMFPLLVGYIFLQWLFSSFVYIYFPEVPSRYVGIPALLSAIMLAPQSILTEVYLYVKTEIIKLKWTPYIIGYVFLLSTTLLTSSLLYFAQMQGRVFLPIPEILALTPTVPVWGWFGGIGLFLGSTIGFISVFFFVYFLGSVSLWFYVWVKANKVFGLKSGIFYTGYAVIPRIVMLIAFYFNLPYFVIYGISNLLLLPQTILTAILVDRYRLRNLGVTFRF